MERIVERVIWIRARMEVRRELRGLVGQGGEEGGHGLLV